MIAYRPFFHAMIHSTLAWFSNVRNCYSFIDLSLVELYEKHLGNMGSDWQDLQKFDVAVLDRS